MMAYSSTLLTLSEVSATFAGFAALVTLFARRRVEGQAAHDLLRLRLVIGASVVVVVAALIPVALLGVGLEDTVIWQISAVVFLAMIYFVIGSFIGSYNMVQGDFPPDKLAVSVAILLETFIQIGLIAVALGFAEGRQFNVYVAALIATIAQAAFVFLRLVESTFSNIVYRTERPNGAKSTDTFDKKQKPRTSERVMS